MCIHNSPAIQPYIHFYFRPPSPPSFRVFVFKTKRMALFISISDESWWLHSCCAPFALRTKTQRRDFLASTFLLLGQFLRSAQAHSIVNGEKSRSDTYIFSLVAIRVPLDYYYYSFEAVFLPGLSSDPAHKKHICSSGIQTSGRDQSGKSFRLFSFGRILRFFISLLIRRKRNSFGWVFAVIFFALEHFDYFLQKFHSRAHPFDTKVRSFPWISQSFFSFPFSAIWPKILFFFSAFEIE